MVRQRMDHLRDSRTCPMCEQRESDVITSCGHMFCSQCGSEAGGACPICRDKDANPHPVAQVDGIGSKMASIGDLIVRLGAEEAIILFVQWKSMMRSVRSFLRSLRVNVLNLEGNSSQRSRTLHEFQSGGVLLLCLDDCFAGLHLPHVGHVVFAHAIVGEKAQIELLERQAIARCARPGQTRDVQIHSFVIADGLEERLWIETH